MFKEDDIIFLLFKRIFLKYKTKFFNKKYVFFVILEFAFEFY